MFTYIHPSNRITNKEISAEYRHFMYDELTDESTWIDSIGFMCGWGL